MAHEIDFSLGRAAYAYDATDGGAWHGLGAPIPEADARDPLAIARHAGAAYSVQRGALTYSATLQDGTTGAR